MHLDVDVLDEQAFPATDYLMPGGLSRDELAELMRPLLASPGLAGVSLACYNPAKDPGGAGARYLAGLFRRAALTAAQLRDTPSPSRSSIRAVHGSRRREISAAAASASRSTRSTLPPASLAHSGSVQPRRSSSAISAG